MNRLTAFRSAATVAQQVMNRLHRDQTEGLDDLSFPPPDGFVPERICALTGKRATHACNQVFVEWFRPGQEPTDDCDAHMQQAVDVRDGRRAGPETPPQFVQVQTATVLPARYAAWSEAAGLSRCTACRPSRDAWELPFPGRPPDVRIVAPDRGAHLLRDPDSPATSTLALRAIIDPPVEQVVWYVDGAPFRVVSYPYTARWPLIPGEHVFEARLLYQPVASKPVRVTVQ